jgi:hypothetical protein
MFPHVPREALVEDLVCVTCHGGCPLPWFAACCRGTVTRSTRHAIYSPL